MVGEIANERPYLKFQSQRVWASKVRYGRSFAISPTIGKELFFSRNIIFAGQLGLEFGWRNAIFPNTISLGTIGQPAFGMALEAGLPEVSVRSAANPRSLLTLVLSSILWQICFVDWRSLDPKTLATLAFLDTPGAEQSLLICFVDLGGSRPAVRYLRLAQAP